MHDFDTQLTALLPDMRRWAVALTHDRSEADDLVQDVAAKALAAKDSFEPGTNFRAWIRRIMVNHFISARRNRREFSAFDDMPELPMPANHEDRLALSELELAFHGLQAVNRQALSLVVLEERSYEDAAGLTGEAIGTLKSRVHRAREQLRSYLAGEPIKAAA